MDNFKIIYRILRFLERSLDLDEVDYSQISHEALGISKARWDQLLIMMADAGFIERLTYSFDISGKPFIAEPVMPLITLKGLMFLEENSMMKKAANMAKGIIEVIK